MGARPKPAVKPIEVLSAKVEELKQLLTTEPNADHNRKNEVKNDE